MTAAVSRQAYRADVDVFFDARRALDHSLQVPTTVHVQVVAGVASLTGRVRWRGERAEAEAAVRQVPGVRRVTNHIAIETASHTALAS
jgi:osmotically-inducible protein OsmY